MPSDATTEDIRKETWGFYNGQLSAISLQSVKNVTKSLFDPQLIYESTFTTPDVLKSG
jgi:hypothetical protein